MYIQCIDLVKQNHYSGVLVYTLYSHSVCIVYIDHTVAYRERTIWEVRIGGASVVYIRARMGLEWGNIGEY